MSSRRAPFVVLLARTAFTLAMILQLVGANFAPRFTADMNGHLIPESTPVQSSVFRLQGTDPENDTLRFGILNSDFFSVEPVTGVVRLLRKLDREVQMDLRLNLTLSDSDPSNQVVQSVVAFVLDENDTPPKFSGLSYQLRVPENTASSSTLAKFTVFDADLVNEGLRVTCEQEPGSVSCDKIEIEQDNKYPTLTGRILLKQGLRYDDGSVFPFRLVARDGVHEVVEALTLVVEDVQDTPPRFLGSLSGTVVEDAPPGTRILTLSAVDGDKGFARKIQYILLDTKNDMFRLDPDSGALETAKELDREILVPSGLLVLPVAVVDTLAIRLWNVVIKVLAAHNPGLRGRKPTKRAIVFPPVCSPGAWGTLGRVRCITEGYRTKWEQVPDLSKLIRDKSQTGENLCPLSKLKVLHVPKRTSAVGTTKVSSPTPVASTPAWDPIIELSRVGVN